MSGTRARERAPASASPSAAAAPSPAPQAPSRALGKAYDGRLVNGVQLPESGPGFATWDPIRKRVGNRPWRRDFL